MLRRALLSLALLLACLAIGATGYAAYTSPEFANCQQHEGRYPTPENHNNEKAVVFVPTPSNVRVLWACVGGYANANGSAITAIATAFLTFVTFILGYLAWDQGQTNRRQLRAYVLLDEGNLWDASAIGEATASNAPQIIDGEKFGYVIVRLKIKNSGQTPAKNVRHYTKIGVGSEASEIWYCPGIPEDKSGKTFSNPIGPGGVLFKKLWLAPFPLGADFANEMLLERKAIFISGTITYDDIFGVERTTDYKLFYCGVWPPIPSGTFTFAAKGNGFT